MHEKKQKEFIENIACYTLSEDGTRLTGLIDFNGELRTFTINGSEARKIHRLRVAWENE
jgi:hypothetical protein